MISSSASRQLLFATILASLIILKPSVGLSQNPQPADVLLRAAFVDFAGGEWEKAAGAFSEFLSSYGASHEAATVRPQILPALAGCYIQLRRGGDALPIIQQYLAEYPQGDNVEEMRFWIGLAHFMEQEFAEALQPLRDFVKNFPNSRRVPDARMLIGVCLFQGGKFLEAADAFAEAAKFTSDALDRERSLLMRLQCYIELSDKDTAYQILQELRKSERPLNQQALLAIQSLKIGDLFFEAEDYDTAYRCYLFVPLQKTLLDRQEEVLTEVRKNLAQNRARGAGGAAAVQRLERLEQSLLQERSALEKMEAFDASRHLRLAQCAMFLGRYPEAYVAAFAVAEKLKRDDLSASGHYLAILATVNYDRWERALRDIRSFIERYPKHERITQVSYLEGQALMGLYRWAEASQVFTAFHEKYPAAPESPRALFLSGYCILFDEKYQQATDIFVTFKNKFPKDSLAEQNAYWYAMTSVFAKDWAQVIDRFSQYLSSHPQGAFRADAEYRIGLAHLRLKNHTNAINLLSSWLRNHEGHILQNEVLAALGDAFLAEGRIDEGIAVFSRIRADENRKLFDYGQFQIGRAYRELEQPENVIQHFLKFVENHGESSRLIEALNQIAWGYRAIDQPDKAREVYQKAIDRFANDPRNTTVEQILQGLAGVSKDPDTRAKLLQDLRSQEQILRREGKMTHAARNLWLYSRLLRREEPATSKKAFEELISNYDKQYLPASTLAEIGEYLIAENRHKEAEPYFQYILDQYSGSAQKNQALAGLGLIYAHQGLDTDALKNFDRLIKEAPQSSLMAKVLEARGDIFVKRRKYDDAISDYMQILEIPTAKGIPWVRALFKIGRAHEDAGRVLEATAFYERIYLLYARYREWVAKAYLARGLALESLQKKTEAAEVYRELLTKEELSEFPEFIDARRRLNIIEPQTAS
jgi:TolA-binding protein